MKINSKWIKYLNVSLVNIKLPEENIGRTLFDINCKNTFLELFARVMEIKTKISKWDLIKLKSYCIVKETINKMKWQPRDWEKILANNATKKGFISKICKQLVKLNVKRKTEQKQTTTTTKWTEDLYRHFSREDIQMANRHMKRCLTSLTVVVQSLSHVQLFETPWTATCQASMLFSISWSFQIHVHWVDDAIQPPHPLSPPSPPAFNLSKHQSLFQWSGSLHQGAKAMKLQHQSFQWIFMVDFL